jgi:hypothetical protein
MVGVQLVDPRVQSAEGPAVGRQHQGVFGQRAKAVDRGEEQAERITQRVARHHRNVGRDARQQHVAGNQHAEFGAIQAHVFRGVAVADDGAPVVVADPQRPVGEQALVGGGDFRHAALVAVAARDERVHARLVEAVAAEEFDHGGNRVAGDLFGHHVRRQVFALRDPQRGAGFPFQPGREAEMVGVAMGHDAARQAPPRQHRLPGVLDRVLRKAGIDRGVAVAVGQQPEVDVVQRKRQRHAQPFDAGGDRHGRAGGGGGLVRVGDGSVQAVSLCRVLCIGGRNLLNLSTVGLPSYPIFRALCAVQHRPHASVSP